MKQSRLFTSLFAILPFVFALNACTPPTTGGDTTRPTVTSVTSTGNSSVNVVFSEAIVGATTASNFSITPALGVSAASVSSDGKTVTLTTASQTKNTKYALGVASSIKDAAGNLVDPTPALAFTGRGGKLTVTVTGLPAGVNPDVVVTEADNSSQQVKANSVVLDNMGSGTLSFAVKAVKPDAATFSDDSSPKSLNFVAGVGGNVALKYACSVVKPPDAKLDAELKVATGKQTYNCADLAKITSFTASNKEIVEIDSIQYATGLTSLDLISNKISVLPENVFDKLTRLTALGLEFNQISVLPANVFDKLTQLTFLRLDNNQISVLPANVFDKLTQLTFLGLNSNCLAAQQEPLKTILSKVKGTVNILSNPKAGCPQKTISIVSITTQQLTTAHNSLEGETIYLKTRIDGVAQADGDPIFTKTGDILNINQSLFVNSELRVELFTQDIAGDIKIGEATVTIDNPYTVGLVIVPLTENGAVYVLKLEKK
jgi:Leucine rich repeat/Bacterial Ig-like domain